MSKQFYCVRQQAGRLVKEYRGTIPPRYSATDTDEDRRDKTELKRQRRTVLNRDSTDRLELMIALMGDQATHYILEFDDEHLPRSFADVRKALRSFLRRVERFRGNSQLDYIPAIEGKHGDHRYHIHLVADFRQLPAAVVQHLWTGGEVTDWPVFRRHGKTLGFRYLAKYLVKERSDGIIIPIGRHPWSCARSCRLRRCGSTTLTESRSRTVRCCRIAEAGAIGSAAITWQRGSILKLEYVRVRATLLVDYWIFVDKQKGWRARG